MSTSAGFSAAVDYFGTISGLSAKSSSDGASSALAEASNEYGDTIASDEHSKLLNPSTEYAVTGTVTLSGISLGSVKTVTVGSATHYIMLTSVAISTGAGQSPTVTISGVEVESSTAPRTYALTGSLTPRSKSQDPAGAFTAVTNMTSVNTTFTVDAHVQMVDGAPVASDCSHGRVEVSATLIDPTGNGSITGTSDFKVSSADSKSAPDVDYVTHSATLVKFLTGTEASANQ